jgi:hypothetical protein
MNRDALQIRLFDRIFYGKPVSTFPENALAVALPPQAKSPAKRPGFVFADNLVGRLKSDHLPLTLPT